LSARNYCITFNDEENKSISDDIFKSQAAHRKRREDSIHLKDFQVPICFGSNISLKKAQKSFEATDTRVINGDTILEKQRIK